jgi:poly(3-hydroxybutyrate) depolymerase
MAAAFGDVACEFFGQFHLHRSVHALHGIDKEGEAWSEREGAVPMPVPVPTHLHTHTHTHTTHTHTHTTMFPCTANHGFITVAPEEIERKAGFNGGGCCGKAAATGVDDLGFFGAVVDAVAAAHPEAAREFVYGVGWSNGGCVPHCVSLCVFDAATGQVCLLRVCVLDFPLQSLVVQLLRRV